MKLHKIYLLPEYHQKGLGSRLLQHVIKESSLRGFEHLILCVNKNNTKAIAAYKNNGFTVAESIVTDIGNGFVMDDFLMMKDL